MNMLFCEFRKIRQILQICTNKKRFYRPIGVFDLCNMRKVW